MRSDRVNKALREIKTAMKLYGGFSILGLVADALILASCPDALRELRGYALELNEQNSEEPEKN